MSQKRYYEVDILYAIGTFLVVLGHSHSSNWENFQGTILVKNIDVIYTFHMPLFFFIAGFLFWNSNKLFKIGYKKWIKEKTIKLLTPYIILTVIGGIPKYYVENGSLAGIGTAMVRSLVFPRMNIWGHFWFILVLLEIYIMFGVICLKIKEAKKRLIISFLIASLGWLLPLNTMLLGLEDIHNMVIYFVMGMIFCYFHLEQRNEKVFFRILIMFLTLMIANVLMNYCEYNSRCVKMFEAVCWIGACWEVAFLIRKSKLATWISNHNFTIYIYSWLFQSVFMLFCDRMGVIWYLETMIMFLAGILGPVCIIEIYERTPKLQCKIVKLIIGEK